MRKQRFEFGAPRGERFVAKVAVADAEKIEEHDRRGHLAGEHLDARRRGMDAKLQRVEVETAFARDDQFAVEHAALGKLRAQGIDHVGEVAVERLCRRGSG